MVREGAPTEVSPEGYVNNVYWAPVEGVPVSADRKKGQQKGEEEVKEEDKDKEEVKSKVMVDKAINGDVGGASNVRKPFVPS